MKPQPTKPTNLATLFLDAADVLRQKGWIQGSGRSREGLCLWFAIVTAANSDHNLAGFALTALEKRIGKCLMDWNDAPGRTREQAIAELEAAAWENR